MSYYGYITDNDKGIVNSWDECKLKTNKVSGAKFKKFKTLEEAKDFIEGKEESDSFYENGDVFFVDGSFDQNSNYYSYGLVYLKDLEIIHMESGKSNKYPESRQVGGEIMGVMKALNYASKNNMKDVKIAYDYEGIRSHALGLWKPKEETSKIYKAWFDDFISKNKDMNISFVKVKAHSGIIFNEYADELAKKELGMSGPYMKKMLEKLKKVMTKN